MQSIYHKKPTRTGPVSVIGIATSRTDDIAVSGGNSIDIRRDAGSAFCFKRASAFGAVGMTRSTDIIVSRVVFARTGGKTSLTGRLEIVGVSAGRALSIAWTSACFTLCVTGCIE